MSHWSFIAAAYGLTLLGTVGVTAWSWSAMRRAERDVDALKGDR